MVLDQELKNRIYWSPQIKITDSCNLGCLYCLVEPNLKNPKPKRCSDETLANAIQKFVEFQPKGVKTHFEWHGGEPLFFGLDPFVKILELEAPFREKGYVCENSIQTNATLLNEEIIDFIIKNKFGIGVSIDGPEDIHNSVRKYKNGAGSFDRVLSNIKLLQGKKVNFGAISVLTKQHVGRIGELYEFFKEHDVTFNVNPLEKEGSARGCFDHLSPTPEEYAGMLLELSELYFFDKKPTIRINTLKFMAIRALSENLSYCNHSGKCSLYNICVSTEGDVYPCSRLDHVEGFKLGNINHDSLEDIASSDLFERLLKRSSQVEECRSCEAKPLCNSGCMSSAYVTHGDINSTPYYCKAYKMVFPELVKIMNAAVRNQSGGEKNGR